jgi:hypothetical protein
VGDLESGVEIFAIICLRLEVPIEDEEVDAGIVCPGELLFDRASRIVLPTGEGLAVLEGTINQSFKMHPGYGTGPSVEVVSANARTGLCRGGCGRGDHTGDREVQRV